MLLSLMLMPVDGYCTFKLPPQIQVLMVRSDQIPMLIHSVSDAHVASVTLLWSGYRKQADADTDADTDADDADADVEDADADADSDYRIRL